MPVMDTHPDSRCRTAPARLLLHHAGDELDAALAGIAGTRLSPQARDKIALEAAALMGRLEGLLSLLRWTGNQAPRGGYARECDDDARIHPGEGLTAAAAPLPGKVRQRRAAWPAARENWRSAAACTAADPDLFFPLSASGKSLEQVRQAKAICAGCPVRRACLAFALRTGQVHGIWGGLTEAERYRRQNLTHEEQALHVAPDRHG
jgi:WhiB family transcriptional regulator, redox-sensing transcriptional regulator